MRIGVFDSGIGGLTVLAALIQAFPDNRYIYLGDTARVPYGTRSPETVVRYALRVASYLYGEGIDLLVIACNTATAHALPALREAGDELGMPVIGVIDPGVTAARAAHHDGAIAVLATEGTIRGGAYQRALLELDPGQRVDAVACPLFVPLAEEGWLEGAVPELVAEQYLAHLRGKVDTVILGCTHYPLLAPVIQRVLPGVTLVDSARATVEVVRSYLPPNQADRAEVRFLVTDHVERFQAVGRIFLGRVPEPVTWVDLPPPVGPFAAHEPPAR